MKKTKKAPKKIPYLDYACQKGETVQWDTIRGEHFEGIITEWKENEIAVIKLPDNSLMEVQC
jgi:hypothetical protein